ncbi:hypothetical protein like AT4G29090 [Hibiscus trionum]|uniref:RNase H type-1 domain-containing protein n=1 Tax=Hibiscus trionum TaxID=183268 RepID=A0A9W7IR38_HIBTR|nr:hypothetical protein like AT4G29090 [Hibiscus trionum]
MVPPAEDEIKFNTDGAFKDQHAGCGGVLRTDSGDIRALFSGPIQPFSADFAELVALRTALEIFIEAGWLGRANLVVESDSQTVLNWVANKSLRPWRWWSVFEDIDILRSQINQCTFVHVSRNLNQLADHLAKEGMHRPMIFKAWW